MQIMVVLSLMAWLVQSGSVGDTEGYKVVCEKGAYLDIEGRAYYFPCCNELRHHPPHCVYANGKPHTCACALCETHERSMTTRICL